MTRHLERCSQSRFEVHHDYIAAGLQLGTTLCTHNNMHRCSLQTHLPPPCCNALARGVAQRRSHVY